MGYSCTAIAAYAHDDIIAQLQQGASESSNTWTHNGIEHFDERGRERDDGAVTGSVYRNNPDGKTCHKIGSYRIDPDGTVQRFPTSTAEQRKYATVKANQRYQTVFCRVIA